MLLRHSGDARNHERYGIFEAMFPAMRPSAPKEIRAAFQLGESDSVTGFERMAKSTARIAPRLHLGLVLLSARGRMEPRLQNVGQEIPRLFAHNVFGVSFLAFKREKETMSSLLGELSDRIANHDGDIFARELIAFVHKFEITIPSRNVIGENIVRVRRRDACARVRRRNRGVRNI